MFLLTCFPPEVLCHLLTAPSQTMAGGAAWGRSCILGTNRPPPTFSPAEETSKDQGCGRGNMPAHAHCFLWESRSETSHTALGDPVQPTPDCGWGLGAGWHFLHQPHTAGCLAHWERGTRPISARQAVSRDAGVMATWGQQAWASLLLSSPVLRPAGEKQHSLS